MKVLFVNPKFYAHHPPLGIAYLSAHLKQYDTGGSLECAIYDEAAGDTDLPAMMDRFRPDLVGISSVTSVFPRAVELARVIKAGWGSPVVIGGPHITGMPTSLLEGPFDLGVQGEGEATLLAIVKAVRAGQDVGTLGIPGTISRKGQNVVPAERRPLIADLDAIPSPDRGLLDMAFYAKAGRLAHGLFAKGTSMMPSRGCPFAGCDFCASHLMWGTRPRWFSPRRIVDEIERVIGTYGLNAVIFLDDNFTSSEPWLRQLSGLLRDTGLDSAFRFDCESIANVFTDAKAALLAEMGCVRVEFGFESGHPRILRALKKGRCTVERNEQAVAICARHGLDCYANAVFGYMDETAEELESSAAWYGDPRIAYRAAHVYTPFPGTSGWEECSRRGIIDGTRINWSVFMSSDDTTLVVNQCMPREELVGRVREIQNRWQRQNRGVAVVSGLSDSERYEVERILSGSSDIVAVRRVGQEAAAGEAKGRHTLARRSRRGHGLLGVAVQLLWPFSRLPTGLPRWGRTMGWFWCHHDVIGHHLWFGVPIEMHQRRFVREWLEPGMTVFDVGANQGLYTVLASRRCGPNGRVVAFEPCRRERRKLRWNLLWNRCRNTVVRAEALGHVPAESAVLYGVVGQETGGNSLRPPAPDIATRCREERVAVTSLDVFCEQSGIGRVDFIKADVEGAEREVLQGAARVLSGPERPFVLWEVSDRRTAAWGYPARETVAYLSSLNYLLLEIGDGVLCVHKPRQEYDYTDLLAVPKEKARAFAVRAQRLGWVLLGHDNGAFC